MGILVAMNLYVIRNSKVKLDRSLFSGSILGVASSACASCLFNRFSYNIYIWRIWHTYNRLPCKLSNSIENCINSYTFWALYSIHNKITKPCVFNNRLPNKDRSLQQQEQRQLVQIQSKSKNQSERNSKATNYYSPRLSITNRHLPSGCQRRTSADLEVVPTCLPSFIR